MYWQERYSHGGTSGAGSYGEFAEFKASVINEFCDQRQINSVIEFGCGDGNQLSLMHFKNYLGLDVSQKSIDICTDRFLDDDSKRFQLVSHYSGSKADLALSLDVIYHLVEDDVFERHMSQLFSAANKFVIIYSSNFVESNPNPIPTHVRHRRFTEWIDHQVPHFELVQTIHNATGSVSDFYIYERLMEAQ